MDCDKCNNSKDFVYKLSTTDFRDIFSVDQNFYFGKMHLSIPGSAPSGFYNKKVYLLVVCSQCENIIDKSALQAANYCPHCEYNDSYRSMDAKEFVGLKDNEETVVIKGKCNNCNKLFNLEADIVDSKIYNLIYPYLL